MAFAPEETAPSRSFSDAFADAVTLRPVPSPPHLQSEDEDDVTSEKRLTNRPPPRALTPLSPPSDKSATSTPESIEGPEQPTPSESEKRRDSVPVVTSGEVDDVDMDIDAMLAEEDALPEASGVIHVAPGSQPPPNPDGAVPGADDATGKDANVLATNEAPHISNREFEDARGRPASIHPEAGASAGVSHDDLVRADIVGRLKKVGVTLIEPDEVPTIVLRHMETVLLDGNWIGDETALREVIVTTLVALDPSTYNEKRYVFMAEPLPDLMDVFVAELRKAKAPSAKKLDENRPKKVPPRLPLSSSPSLPRPIPPRSKKR